ncbi:MAG: hypothetical protein ACRDOU_22370, partial [Streptosporangiaceae bacterium]
MSSAYGGYADIPSGNAVESPPVARPTQPPPAAKDEGAKDGGAGHRLAWLDVLRGLAALCVVFDHLSYYLLQPARWAIYQWFDFGN